SAARAAMANGARWGRRQALAGRAGALCAGSQPCPHRQGTRDAAARKLKWLWGRLKELFAMRLKREELLMKLGAARDKARAAWRLVDIEVDPQIASFNYALNRDKLRKVRRREGRYLLRTNLYEHSPEK